MALGTKKYYSAFHVQYSAEDRNLVVCKFPCSLPPGSLSYSTAENLSSYFPLSPTVITVPLAMKQRNVSISHSTFFFSYTV